MCLFVTVIFPSAPAGPVVNDGGLSWLRKNYQRMKEQAEREQRSLNDVVAERYGVRTDGTLAALTHLHAQFSTYGEATKLMRMLHNILFTGNVDLTYMLQ